MAISALASELPSVQFSYESCSCLLRYKPLKVRGHPICVITNMVASWRLSYISIYNTWFWFCLLYKSYRAGGIEIAKGSRSTRSGHPHAAVIWEIDVVVEISRDILRFWSLLNQYPSNCNSLCNMTYSDYSVVTFQPSGGAIFTFQSGDLQGPALLGISYVSRRFEALFNQQWSDRSVTLYSGFAKGPLSLTCSWFHQSSNFPTNLMVKSPPLQSRDHVLPACVANRCAITNEEA